MIQCNERWFYKAPGVSFVDLMPLYFDYKNSGNTLGNDQRNLTLTFFAPPENGENVDDGHSDWMLNYYKTLPSLPKLRVEYEPVLPITTGKEDGMNDLGAV